MNRVLAAAAVLSLIGCAHYRPIPRGAIYETVPQTQRYIELGHVEGSSRAWGEHRNAALHEAWTRARKLGADAIVGIEVETGCKGWMLWFVGLVGFPPCSSSVEGLAIKWLRPETEAPAPAAYVPPPSL